MNHGAHATPVEAISGSWAPPEVAELAEKFPELEILEMLGRGGMGAVYKARQKNLNRVVALKILPPAMAALAGFADRFGREAQAMARLSHPHIVVIYDFGNRRGLFYILMEYVDGLSLRAIMEGGGVAPAEALNLVPQICEALQYAHGRGVIHRDVKPENILLDRQGSIKVTDFGLARLAGTRGVSSVSASRHVLGTPVYMAPEQIEHPGRADHRADIYSLGVVFYQLLTGELPLGRFPPPSRKVQIDVRLDEVVLRTLEKDPSLRYQQAGDVKTDVQTIAATPSNQARSGPGISSAGPRKMLLWSVLLVVGFAAALVAAVVGFAAISSALKARGEPKAAVGASITAIGAGRLRTPVVREPESDVRVNRTHYGWVLLLPRTWRHAHALAVVQENLFVGGMGRTGAELARWNLHHHRWHGENAILPSYWHSVKRVILGGNRLLLIGGSKPEPGGFGVKSRPVAGLLNLAGGGFHDLTSQMRLADADPYILGVGGAAYSDGCFLIGGAGGSTFLEQFHPGGGGSFANLARAVPYYFAANNIVALNSGFLIDGGGAGPGGEPGTPPALGLVSMSGQFTDLTRSLPPGIGVMGASAFDGRYCLIQSFNTVDAHQMLELVNPADGTFRQVTALFPPFLSVQAIAGRAGEFVVGGFYGPGAYLGLYRPATGVVRNLTAELPLDARTIGAAALSSMGTIASGQTAQDRTFVAVIHPRAARGPAP